MIAPVDIRTRYPEFSDATAFPDARIQLFIDDAETELAPIEWGIHYDRGMSALTAHFLSIATMTANGGGTSGSLGPVASRSVGDVSLSFGGMGGGLTQMENYFLTTPYGQEYWRMVQLYGVGMLTV